MSTPATCTIPDSFQVLADDDILAEAYTHAAAELGINVTGSVVWQGIIPPNSFEWLNQFVRMSTPEYFFYRKANELHEWHAVDIAEELCGYYRTHATTPDVPAGSFERRDEPATTVARIREYLAPVASTEPGRRALAVLAHVRGGKREPDIHF